MIIVLFGQPGSGKTTLSRHLSTEINGWILDGDRMRHVFQDKDFTRPGRIKNLNRASDIAVFEHSTYRNTDVIIAMVYPYKEAREYLTEMCKRLEIPLKWVCLDYELDRGREHFHVEDFEYPDKDEALYLNTEWLTEEQCIKQIYEYVGEENTR